MSHRHADDPTGVQAHVQEALCRVLLQRPANPVEVMAEYFRTAAALESLSTPSSASSIGSFSPTFLPSGSTPFTRALFILQSTSHAASNENGDGDANALSLHDRIASAFEELASLSFDNGGLLGSLLLAKPKPSTRGQSLTTSAVTVTSGKDKQSTGEAAGDAAAGLDSSDLRLLLTRLFGAPPAAAPTTATADWIPLPTDVQQILLSGLMDEAASDSAPAATPSSSRITAAAAAPLIGFAGFSRAILAQRQLSSLYAHLASLLLVLCPPPAHLRSSDAKLMHLQTSSISLSDLQELVRLIVQRSKQSAAKRGLSEAQIGMLVAAVQSVSSPSSHGSGSARSAPPSSVSLMSFIRAVLQGSLNDLARARNVRRAGSARHQAWKQSGSPAVSAASAAHFSPQPFGPAVASVYAAAFHHNPAQAGAACSEESTETVEYKS